MPWNRAKAKLEISCEAEAGSPIHKLARWEGIEIEYSTAALVNAASTLEPDIDRLGMDYRGFDVPTAQPARCQEACDLDRQCQAYTFVKPGVQGPQARCYLKNPAPPATPDPCCTSGVKRAPSAGR